MRSERERDDQRDGDVEDQILTAANTLSDEDVVGRRSATPGAMGASGTTTTLGQSDVGNVITVTAKLH